MKKSDRIAYGLVAVIALAPVGVRSLFWPKPRQQPADAATAQAGQVLFVHEWTPRDPLSAGGDGLGPVFNATSCVACHHQGGVGGSGGLKNNVTLFTLAERPGGRPRQGVVHAFAVKYQQETLANVHPSLPPIIRPTLQQVLDFSSPQNRLPPGCGVPAPRRSRSTIQFVSGVDLSQRNTPALFGANLV